MEYIRKDSVLSVLKSPRSITQMINIIQGLPSMEDNMCDCCGVCKFWERLKPEIHTIKEWAELPDKVSVLGKWYAWDSIVFIGGIISYIIIGVVVIGLFVTLI